jgi:nicotinamide-nucleotide amidase
VDVLLLRIPMTASLSQLAANLHELAVAHGTITVATAESCTGGNIAHHITLNPGSSGYFLGGVVSYANHVKEQVLGVPADILANPGAVSAPCARAMAEGARRLLGADLAVATTGIAGPAGGSERKPVGLVYIGFASLSGTIVEEHVFPGGRAAVIEASTHRALELLRDALTDVRSASDKPSASS